MALFEREGAHAVEMRYVAIGFEGAVGEPQHAVEVANVETVLLAHLDGEHVARESLGQRFVRSRYGLEIVAILTIHCGEPKSLAFIHARRQASRMLEKGQGVAIALPVLHRQMQQRRHHHDHRAVRIAVDGGEEFGQAIAVSEPLLAQKIERGNGARRGVADR